MLKKRKLLKIICLVLLVCAATFTLSACKKPTTLFDNPSKVVKIEIVKVADFPTGLLTAQSAADAEKTVTLTIGENGSVIEQIVNNYGGLTLEKLSVSIAARTYTVIFKLNVYEKNALGAEKDPYTVYVEIGANNSIFYLDRPISTGYVVKYSDDNISGNYDGKNMAAFFEEIYANALLG
ncbi:MAG: hypothetical protein LBT30_03755 [Clostridiales bacterium]|jgi:hypothetical protein|nr:hypothetical protein [Clostridiales bacterium]